MLKISNKLFWPINPIQTILRNIGVNWVIKKSNHNYSNAAKLLVHMLGGKVINSDKQEYGRTSIN